MHEEKFEITGVVDEESLVAGGHHVAGLPVATVADLETTSNQYTRTLVVWSFSIFYFRDPSVLSTRNFFQGLPPVSAKVPTHLGHSGLAGESSPDSIVDTLGLPPVWCHTLEAVGLVTVEARGALLHDRNVLLCGDHLNGSVSIARLSSEGVRLLYRTVTAVG